MALWRRKVGDGEVAVGSARAGGGDASSRAGDKLVVDPDVTFRITWRRGV